MRHDGTWRKPEVPNGKGGAELISGAFAPCNVMCAAPTGIRGNGVEPVRWFSQVREALLHRTHQMDPNGPVKGTLAWLGNDLLRIARPKIRLG